MAQIRGAIALLAALMALALAGCAEPPRPLPSAPVPTVTVLPSEGPAEPSVTVALIGGSAEELTGRWLPVDFDGTTNPDLEFREDESWRGFDGCNTTEGRWLAQDGFIHLTAGPSTLIGCDGVATASFVLQAAEFRVDGDHLLLLDSAGALLLALTRTEVPAAQ